MSEVILLWAEEQSRKLSGSSFRSIFAPPEVLLKNHLFVMRGSCSSTFYGPFLCLYLHLISCTARHALLHSCHQMYLFLFEVKLSH